MRPTASDQAAIQIWAAGDEDEAGAVGGEAAVALAGAVSELVLLGASISGYDPEVLRLGVAGEIDIHDGEHDPLAAGGDLGVRDALHGLEVVEGHWTFDNGGGCVALDGGLGVGADGECGREEDGDESHRASLTEVVLGRPNCDVLRAHIWR